MCIPRAGFFHLGSDGLGEPLRVVVGSGLHDGRGLLRECAAEEVLRREPAAAGVYFDDLFDVPFQADAPGLAGGDALLRELVEVNP